MIGSTERRRVGDDPYPYAAVATTVTHAITIDTDRAHLLMAISMAAM